MAIVAKKGGDGEVYVLAPAGVKQGVCVDVIDLGEVLTEFEGKPRKRHMVKVIWQLASVDPQTGKRYMVSKRYTLSLHEKATLRSDLESWRGRPFTIEEEAGFDVEKVKGINALLNIQHVSKATGTYANVVAIMPCLASMGMAKLVPQGYERAVAAPDADEWEAEREATPAQVQRATAPVPDADEIPF